MLSSLFSLPFLLHRAHFLHIMSHFCANSSEIFFKIIARVLIFCNP
nr:MAG TPA: hypothetical protein [Caudoviricetes sp.]